MRFIISFLLFLYSFAVLCYSDIVLLPKKNILPNKITIQIKHLFFNTDNSNFKPFARLKISIVNACTKKEAHTNLGILFQEKY